MKESLSMKSWAGPLTIGSFFVVALTGILLLFHLGSGSVKHVHEAVSLVFVIGAVVHAIVNGKLFLAYFRKPVGIAIIAIFVVIGILAIVPHGESGGFPHGPRMAMKAVDSLSQSSLSVVAQVIKREPQVVIDDLKSHQIKVRNSEQTIAQIASENDRETFEILAMAFDSTKDKAQNSRE